MSTNNSGYGNGSPGEPGQYGQPGTYGGQQYSTQNTYGRGQYAQQGQYGDPQYVQGGQYGQPGAYGQQQYGTQSNNAYGAPQYDQGYDQAAYGYGAYGQQPMSAPGQGTPVLASWGSRVGAYLLDALISLIPLVVIGGLGLWMAFKDSYTIDTGNGSSELHGVNGSGFVVMGLAWLISLAVQLWNRGIRQGQTGQSIGKKMLHLKVVDEQTGTPTGAGRGFGRFALEFVFGIVSSFVGVLTLLDLLWPLWDNRNQALHDKVVHTLVVRGD